MKKSFLASRSMGFRPNYFLPIVSEQLIESRVHRQGEKKSLFSLPLLKIFHFSLSLRNANFFQNVFQEKKAQEKRVGNWITICSCMKMISYFCLSNFSGLPAQFKEDGRNSNISLQKFHQIRFTHSKIQLVFLLLFLQIIISISYNWSDDFCLYHPVFWIVNMIVTFMHLSIEAEMMNPMMRALVW